MLLHAERVGIHPVVAANVESQPRIPVLSSNAANLQFQGLYLKPPPPKKAPMEQHRISI